MWRQEPNGFSRPQAANSDANASTRHRHTPHSGPVYGPRPMAAMAAPGISFHVPLAVRSSSAHRASGPSHVAAAPAYALHRQQGDVPQFSANVSSVAPSGVLPDAHDRSVTAGSVPHQASAYSAAALVNSRSSSNGAVGGGGGGVPLDVAARCNYLDAVNADMRRELDRARADNARLQLENSRLKELLNTHSFQNDYLRLQLEKSHSRNASLMHFDSTPEGQAQSEAVEAHNSQLRVALQEKDKELASVQLRLMELQGRVKGFEDALLHGLPVSKGDKKRESGASVPVPASSDGGVDSSALCETLSTAVFVASSFQALHGLFTSRAAFSAEPGDDEARRAVLGRIIEGNSESSAQVRARGFQRSAGEILISAQRQLLQCETTLVKLAAQFLAGPHLLRGLSRPLGEPPECRPPPAIPQENLISLPKPRDRPENDEEELADAARNTERVPQPTPASGAKKRTPDTSALVTRGPQLNSGDYFSRSNREQKTNVQSQPRPVLETSPVPSKALSRPSRSAVSKQDGPAETLGEPDEMPPQGGLADPSRVVSLSGGSQPPNSGALPSRNLPTTSEARPQWASSTSGLSGGRSKSKDDCDVQ
jgi:hypothetical protein